MNKLFFTIYSVFIGAILIFTVPLRAEVITYPAPAGEATSAYTVTVDGKPVDVYAAQCQYFDGDYYFASFDFSGKVVIKIDSTFPLDKTVVQPERFGVKIVEKKSKTITMSADKPFRISVEPNGRVKPLLLFGNAVEKDAPKEGTPQVLYFKPGIHRTGKITLTDNQTIYLAGGAVIKGCIYAKGKNITICGRGILAGEESPRFKGPGRFLIDCQNCQNVTIRDITIRNPWSWTFVVWNCDGVTIDNVKICGSRMINDDALDLVNTENVVVRNCFFRTQDDSIAIKGMAKMTRPCQNVLIEHCEFWTDCANIFRIGYECETTGMRNIRARDIDVLYYSKNYRVPTDYWANAIFWLQPNLEVLMEDCHFENMRIRSNGDNIIMLMAKPMRCIYGIYQQPEPGTLHNCSFKNIQVFGEKKNFKGILYFKGDSPKHNVDNILLESITYFGQPVTEKSSCVEIGDYVQKVMFH